MAKLYIPQVGDKLKLISNWECKVFNEHRNSKVFEGLNIDVSNHKNVDVDLTFPKGTVLKVERLYVRAPASSYDSITFRVDSSPIKSLNKARFWVKLMDANTIEFEEIVNSIDNYSKLKDAYRFVALSKHFQNSERLSEEENNIVIKELYNHFKTKDNELLFKFDISWSELVHKTIKWGRQFRYMQRSEELIALEKEAIEKGMKISEKVNVQLLMVPVLDGYIVIFKENDKAIELDKQLNLYDKKEEGSYYDNSFNLGSYLSRNYYTYFSDKNTYPLLLSLRMDDKESKDYVIERDGNILDIKDYKELNKLIKSIRSKK